MTEGEESFGAPWGIESRRALIQPLGINQSILLAQDVRYRPDMMKPFLGHERSRGHVRLLRNHDPHTTQRQGLAGEQLPGLADRIIQQRVTDASSSGIGAHADVADLDRALREVDGAHPDDPRGLNADAGRLDGLDERASGYV